jgi:hypothetical protein
VSGAIPPLHQYAFMVWCPVKTQGQLYLFQVIMNMTQNQKQQQIYKVTMCSKSCEIVSQFAHNYLEIEIERGCHDEIRRGMKSGNAFYYSVRKLLSSSLLSKTPKVRVYKQFCPMFYIGVNRVILTSGEQKLQAS